MWTFIDGNPLNIDAEMLPLFLLVYTEEEEEEALIFQILEDSCDDEVESDPEGILISPWDCGTSSRHGQEGGLSGIMHSLNIVFLCTELMQ